MQNENLEELTVGGYVFSTHDDAELAKNEIKKIAYIESKMDMSNMTVVLGIYNKALENRTFQTPIGMEFMHGLYQMLISSGIDKTEEVKPFPLYVTFRRIDLSETKRKRRVITQREREENSLRLKLRNSYIITGIMVFLVVALLFITFNGTTMNAINYKSAVTNQYAAWEQDLTKREAAIREKERELGISHAEPETDGE